AFPERRGGVASLPLRHDPARLGQSNLGRNHHRVRPRRYRFPVPPLTAGAPTFPAPWMKTSFPPRCPFHTKIPAAASATTVEINTPFRRACVAQESRQARPVAPSPQIPVSSCCWIADVGTPIFAARSLADSPLKYAPTAPTRASERSTGANQRIDSQRIRR